MARSFGSGGDWKSVLMMALTWTLLPEVRAEVKLVDHGYEGIVIAINPYLKQEQGMLKRLEQFLTNTSKTLFRATRNQLFFREFIIVVPETWKGHSNFENALDVQLDRAQIIIDNANPAYGDAPYVKQYAECGQPGLYIHLTPSYLLDDDVVIKWGQPEKTLVHEWAHLRWGLFDEYPIDAQDAEFYRYGGSWHPTRCTEDVEGSILNEFTSKQCSFDYFTGKPEKSCRFFPRMKSNPATASLMFMQYLESIVDFCDDPVSAPKQVLHNYLAPNRQNRLCAYRSAWEVMRKHEDFRKARRPLPDDTNTRPMFRYVQVQPRKRALVLDTSGSMTQGASLSVMMRAASNYILSCIESGSRLGIVQFNTNATALSPMIQVNREEDRQRLIEALPRQADGKTSIGAGLEKGLQLLNTVEKQAGGTIILITDGRENERPFLTDFQQKLQSKGVVVHSLAYGQRAEKSIAQLSRKTGGKTFYYSGRKDSTALIDGLAATVRSEGSNLRMNVPISLVTYAGMASNNSPMTGTFIVDSTVGLETSLTISYSEDVNVTVTSPSNVTLSSETHPEHFKFDKQSGVIKILLPGKAEIGKWTYNIDTTASQADVAVNVQSKAREKNGEVLQISSWLSWLHENNTLSFDAKQKITVFAELIRGRASVLDADVTAVIERPRSVPLTIPLYDNGVGSDIIKEDGIYAAYVLASDLTADGRYNIKIKARSIDGTTTVVVGGKGPSSGALDQTGSGTLGREVLKAKMGLFQRVTSAGEFQVTGFPSSASSKVPDLMPPSRITDFHVSRFDPNSGEARLRWTAVGDNMDRGVADKYVLHISEDFDKLLTLTSNETDWANTVFNDTIGSMKPKSAGQMEDVIIQLGGVQDKTTLFLSLRAVDDNGNHGELSNIVTVSRAEKLAVPIQINSMERGLEFYLQLVVPPVATLLLLVILIVVVMLSRRRNQKTAEVAGLEEKDKAMSASTCSLDLFHMAHMNYRHEGQYRLRHEEDPETWSQLARSRENLDAL